MSLFGAGGYRPVSEHQREYSGGDSRSSFDDEDRGDVRPIVRRPTPKVGFSTKKKAAELVQTPAQLLNAIEYLQRLVVASSDSMEQSELERAQRLATASLAYVRKHASSLIGVAASAPASAATPASTTTPAATVSSATATPAEDTAAPTPATPAAAMIALAEPRGRPQRPASPARLRPERSPSPVQLQREYERERERAQSPLRELAEKANAMVAQSQLETAPIIAAAPAVGVADLVVEEVKGGAPSGTPLALPFAHSRTEPRPSHMSSHRRTSSPTRLAAPSSSSAATPNTAANANTKHAILIGNNYEGKSYSLEGCVNDVRKMAEALTRNGWLASNITILLNEDATWSIVQRAVERVAGGTLVIQFSGHALRKRDTNGDEVDGRDECLLLEDGIVADDTLKVLVQQVAQRCNQVFLWFDCCHAGTIADVDTMTQHNVVCFSGCRDSEYAVDGGTGETAYGAFSHSLFYMVGESDGAHVTMQEMQSMLENRMKKMGGDQSPMLTASRPSLMSSQFPLRVRK